MQTRQLQVQQGYIGGQSVATDHIPHGKQNDDLFKPNFVAIGRPAKFGEILKLSQRINRQFGHR